MSDCEDMFAEEMADMYKNSKGYNPPPKPLKEATTSALIAELEKRRPEGCPDKCKHLGSQLCGGCFWNFLIGENSDTIKDNFKEAA